MYNFFVSKRIGVLSYRLSSLSYYGSHHNKRQCIHQNFKKEFFSLLQTFRHGFPHSPTALAYDPVQKLLAIGDKSGSLRMYPFNNELFLRKLLLVFHKEKIKKKK